MSIIENDFPTESYNLIDCIPISIVKVPLISGQWGVIVVWVKVGVLPTAATKVFALKVNLSAIWAAVLNLPIETIQTVLVLVDEVKDTTFPFAS